MRMFLNLHCNLSNTVSHLISVFLKSPGLTLPANCETGTINFIEDVGPEQKDITQILSSSPVFPEVPVPPQLPMNGMVMTTQKYVECVIMVMGYTVRQRRIKATSFSSGNPRGFLKIDCADIYISLSSWYRGRGGCAIRGHWEYWERSK